MICPSIKRKDPVRNRAALIEAATNVIVEHGLARLTVDSVARAAGVTKGGLFHHFASKDDLIRGVLNDMMDRAETSLEETMAADPEPHGRFTRAYLEGVCGKQGPEAATSRALCVAMLGDPTLSDYWTGWVEDKIAANAATDDNSRCAMVRLAADGIWLSSLNGSESAPSICADVRAGLLALTYPE